VGRDAGEIALMYDSDGVVARRNLFSLDGRALGFIPTTPQASRYKVAADAASFDRQSASAGALLDSLGDDDTRRVALPFPFPFFGATFTSVFVNSDGNLSFGQGDVTATSRSLGFFAGGAPRIAPLLADLDPSVARGGVRVLARRR